MFQNFASYLLGYSNQTEGGPPAATEGVENNANTRLTAKEAEDDWIFVDQQDGEDSLLFDEELKHQDDSDILVVEDGTEDGCGDLGGDFDTIADAVASMASSRGHLISSTRSLSSLPGAASAVEESWFLTPPRCFISTGPPVNMATSPLENLLIEHPSMSVYCDPMSSARREPEWFDPINSDPSSEDEEEDDDMLKGKMPALKDDVALDMGFQIMEEQRRPMKQQPPVAKSVWRRYDQNKVRSYERLFSQGMAMRNRRFLDSATQQLFRDFVEPISGPEYQVCVLRELTPNYEFILDDHLAELEEEKENNEGGFFNKRWLRDIKVEIKARSAEVDRIADVMRQARAVRSQDLADTNKHVDHNKLPEPQCKQVVALKRAQKVQVNKSRKAKSKGHMDRNNKAREVNCRNRRQRRGERSQGPNRSHANNNRKC